MKSLKEFNSEKLNLTESRKVFAGDPCGTSYTMPSGSTGRDTYFDVNDNGRLDSGDLVDLDTGQTIVMM